MILEELKIALKQIFIHKNRAIYIFILSFFLGLLTIILSILSISIKNNGKDIAYKNYESKDVYYAKFDTYSDDTDGITKNNFNNIIDYINIYSKEVNLCTLHIKFLDINFGYISDLSLLENKGHITINEKANLSNEKYVYLEKNYAIANNYNIGDEYIVTKEIENVGVFTYKYKIGAIYTINTNIVSSYNIIFDKNAFNENANDFSLNFVSIQFEKNIDVKRIVDVNEKIIDYFIKLNNGGLKITSTYKYYSDVVFFTDLFFYITLALTILLLVTTIAILSNSINILIDVNKDYLGLLRIVGANNKIVRNIIIFELLIIVFSALLLSYVIFYSITPLIDLVFNKLLYSIFYFVDAKLLNSCTLATYYYLPFIVIIIVTIFIGLWTIIKINKTLKLDSISMLRRLD